MRYSRFVLITTLAIAVSIAAAAPASAAPVRTLKGCNPAAAAKVVVATNAYRASLGLPHLTVVPKLSAFAVMHANDMAIMTTLTHSSSTGLSFAQRARDSSYRFSTMRENIAVESAPLPSALGPNLWSLWRHSPEHDANMRARDVTQIGVAVAPGANGCYASMELGSQRA